MTTARLWLVAAAWWAGCLRPGPWPLAFVAPLLLRLFAAHRATRPSVVLAAVVLAGSGLAGGHVALRDGPLAGWVGRDVVAVGTVVTDPRPSGRDGVWYLVRLERVGGGLGDGMRDDSAPGQRIRARVLVRQGGGGPGAGVVLGARVALSGRIEPLESSGFEQHVRRLHAGARLEPWRVTVRGPPGAVLAATNTVRERVRMAFAVRLSADRASLLSGLALGDETGRSPEFDRALAASGLTHLVVVSGRNVALLLAAVIGICGLLRVGPRGRAWICLGVLAVYVVLTRWQPSVLRAGVMAGIVLGAVLTGRRADARHSLAAAVLLLLVVDPLLAGQPGFVLSVLATGGVLVVAPWLMERLPGPRPARAVVAATLGAQVGAAPALLAFFGSMPLAAIPANVVAAPAAATAQLMGVAAALVACLSPPAGAFAASLATPWLAVVEWAAYGFARGPVVDGRGAVLLATVGALLTARRVPRVRALAAVLIGALAMTAAWPTVRPEPGVAVLTVTMIDVGQGDALLIEVPAVEPAATKARPGPLAAASHGTAPVRVLVDGGPEPDAVARWLRRRGIRRLDAVVLTHPHQDHSGGLAQVLRDVRVGALLVAPQPLTDAAPVSARRTYEAAEARGTAVRLVAAGASLRIGALGIEVLSPPPGGVPGGTVNDHSLVLRLEVGGRRLLLTGDVEAAGQALLLARPDRLRAELLKVPHHGGDTNAAGFLAAVRPRVALIGVGRDNDYGHPATAVLRDLARVTVLRTDEHGTVTLHAEPGGWSLTAQGGPGAGRRPEPAARPRPAARGGPARRGASTLRAWPRDRRCTCSLAPRSCCCTGRWSGCSTTSAPRARSR